MESRVERRSLSRPPLTGDPPDRGHDSVGVDFSHCVNDELCDIDPPRAVEGNAADVEESSGRPSGIAIGLSFAVIPGHGRDEAVATDLSDRIRSGGHEARP